jgi:putative ATPase
LLNNRAKGSGSVVGRLPGGVSVRLGRVMGVSEGLFDLPGAPPPARGGGSLADVDHSSAPLAVRMRPRSLDELVGQQHLLAPGSPLRRLVEGDQPMSLLLWGPPGTGKTTIAAVVSHATNRKFVELSAVTAGVKEVRQIIDGARRDLARPGKSVETVLFIDEVHRFTKAQQDGLLPGVENRWVTLVAATTENPFFSVISPLLSRSLLLTLESLTDDDIAVLLDRALTDERGLNDEFELATDAKDHLLRMAGGDARRALTYLEAAAGGARAKQAEARDRSTAGPAVIDLKTLETAVDRAAVRYDRAGDQHYDVASALIKSIRGSDVDAAMHYLARMIEAGEDPRFIARRLVISASEDIGMGDPTALGVAVAAADAVQLIGLPEARINLAQAVVALALAPKSNAVIMAIDAAIADVKAGKVGPVPPHLRDAHYAGAKKLGHGSSYQYSHNDPRGVVPQQYAPDVVDDAEYYKPTRRGGEAAYADRLANIRKILKDR